MKRYILFLFSFLALAILISSCASTETTSFVDPAYRGMKFTKICVQADFSDLKYKQKLEKELVSEFSDNKVIAIAGSTLFPPTREWTESQMQEILEKEGIEAYLLIAWQDRDVKETYRPGQLVTETKGEVKKNRSGKEVYTEKRVTTEQGGGVEKEFKSYFEAKLIDVRSKQNAWLATSYSSSGEWFGSDYDLIMESYASDIVKKLINDGLIK